jgi:hypothetical protein
VINSLPPVPPPWRWEPYGPFFILREGSAHRLVLLWRLGFWEVSYPDYSVIRDGVLTERLPALLVALLPRLRLEVPDANDAP